MFIQVYVYNNGYVYDIKICLTIVNPDVLNELPTRQTSESIIGLAPAEQHIIEIVQKSRDDIQRKTWYAMY